MVYVLSTVVNGVCAKYSGQCTKYSGQCTKYSGQCTKYGGTYVVIIESVDSISRDERDVPLTQYITNA